MIVNTGKTLLQRYKGAIVDCNLQQEAHRGITVSLHPQSVSSWGAMCARWDADRFPNSVPNPFHTTDRSEFFYLIHMYILANC